MSAQIARGTKIKLKFDDGHMSGTWPPTPRPDGRPCKHCGLTITEGPSPVHAEGSHRGKSRCGHESGLPYGYNADAEGDPCTPICAGSSSDGSGS